MSNWEIRNWKLVNDRIKKNIAGSKMKKSNKNGATRKLYFIT